MQGDFLHGCVILTVEFFRVNIFVTLLIFAVTKCLTYKEVTLILAHFLRLLFMVGQATSVSAMGACSRGSCSLQGDGKKKKRGKENGKGGRRWNSKL